MYCIFLDLSRDGGVVGRDDEPFRAVDDTLLLPLEVMCCVEALRGEYIMGSSLDPGIKGIATTSAETHSNASQVTECLRLHVTKEKEQMFACSSPFTFKTEFSGIELSSLVIIITSTVVATIQNDSRHRR